MLKLQTCRKGHEVRCVKRKILMETLVKELPSETIRFSSKVVSIEDSGHIKLLHLADGTIIKAKVLYMFTHTQVSNIRMPTCIFLLWPLS